MIDEHAINVYCTHHQITDAAKKELYVKELDNNMKDLISHFLKSST